MGVTRYDVSKGDTRLSEHFNASEFAKDGNQGYALISSELIAMLEKIYKYLNLTCMIITSGYRTPEQSVAVGGYANDRHTKGVAADIYCTRNGQVVSAEIVCCAAQDCGANGIGYISKTATHIDVDNRKWYGIEPTGENNVGDFHKWFGIGNVNETPDDEVTEVEVEIVCNSEAPEATATAIEFDEGTGDSMKADFNSIVYEVGRKAADMLGRPMSETDKKAYATEIVNTQSWYWFDKLIQEGSDEHMRAWIKLFLYCNILDYKASEVPVASVDWWLMQYRAEADLTKESMIAGFTKNYDEFFEEYRQKEIDRIATN